MEKGKQVGSSSSSFIMDLFGPKETSKSSSPSTTGLFGSVFGPPSMGLGKDSSHSGIKQDYGSQYGNLRNGTSDYYMNQKSRSDSRDQSSIYQNETAEPCYFSSSIYYGGQEVYSPTDQSTNTQHIFKKDGEDDDPDGNNSTSASRGNWWQGSLYY
ncbi:hypothetical protein ACH5RR_019298 [Cinchona calisaya]|uniref:Uncharacterized protein n=1 Tax=Cinchona calisaya TaxID=153742 RepID=A0ABD2ZPW6_9GENT